MKDGAPCRVPGKCSWKNTARNSLLVTPSRCPTAHEYSAVRENKYFSILLHCIVQCVLQLSVYVAIFKCVGFFIYEYKYMKINI
jgi:hypothetical protein